MVSKCFLADVTPLIYAGGFTVAGVSAFAALLLVRLFPGENHTRFLAWSRQLIPFAVTSLIIALLWVLSFAAGFSSSQWCRAYELSAWIAAVAALLCFTAPFLLRRFKSGGTK